MEFDVRNVSPTCEGCGVEGPHVRYSVKREAYLCNECFVGRAKGEKEVSHTSILSKMREAFYR